MNGGKANKSGVWTLDEDKLLAEWQSKVGNKWAEVARQIPGKTGQQCAQRWRHRVNPDIRREKWGADEDATLAALVLKHGNSWAIIARSMPGRTDQQCMGRWKRHLDPSIRRESWTPQEDAMLFQLAEEYENAWSAVSRGLAGRTPQQCRTRWHYISGNPNAAEASRAAIQAMRDAQVAAEAAKVGLKKRRGRPSKNALAAAAAGMLTVLAPLPKGTVVHPPRYDPSTDADAYVSGADPHPSTVGVKRIAPTRRPGRPPRKKVPAVSHDQDYPQPHSYNGQYDNNNAIYHQQQHHGHNNNARGSIDGEEAMLLDGFWNAVTAAGGGGRSQPASRALADATERRASAGGNGNVVNRPTRARIPSRRTSFSMSEEDDDSEDDNEDIEEAGYDNDEDDEDFVLKGRYRQQQQQRQNQQMWKRQRNTDHSQPAAAAPAAAAGVGVNAHGAGGGNQVDNDFEGEDDTDNEEEYGREHEDEVYVPDGAGGRRPVHSRAVVTRTLHHNNNDNDGTAKTSQHQQQQQQHQQEEAEYLYGGMRTLPMNQQQPTADATRSPSKQMLRPQQQQQQQQQQEQEQQEIRSLVAAAAAAAAAGADVHTTTAPTVGVHTQHTNQQHYYEEPALLLGSSRAERRVSLGDVPLSPAVFSPALTPPWSRRKRQNHARLAAFGPSVPSSAAPAGNININSNNNNNNNPMSSQHGTPLTNRRHHYHHSSAAGTQLQAGAPLSSPGILGLLQSPESFRRRRADGTGSGAGGDDDDHHHHLGRPSDSDGVGNHHHGHHGNGDEDFFPGVFPDSPALPQFAGLITPEWARAAAAASAAAEDAEVRRFSIASVARRLDVDSVAVGSTARDESPPQAGSLSVSLSLSAGGIPPSGQRIPPSSAPPAGGIATTPCFFPVTSTAGNHLVLTEPPPALAHTTTTAPPSSASHGRSFLAAALQRTVGTGLLPASGTFFPTNVTTMAPDEGGHHIPVGTGNMPPDGTILATPMAIEDLLLAPMGLQMPNGDTVVLQGAMTAPSGEAVPLLDASTMIQMSQAAAEDIAAANAAAVQGGVNDVSFPAGQYNRVILTNTTLTARKDVAPASITAATARPLSSNDVRMTLQALLEQV